MSERKKLYFLLCHTFMLDPLKHKPIYFSKENIVFVLIKGKIYCMTAFTSNNRFSQLLNPQTKPSVL